jgi:hypothetical protein
MTQPTPAQDLLAEARRLHTLAEATSITARLLGGAAVAISAPAPLPAALQRPYKDLDYVVRRADAARWRDLLDTNGYTADTQFNTLHGAQRLLHYDPVNKRQIDTFVSSFAMCHSLDLEDRLPHGAVTLAPADILLTKLQIYEVIDTRRLAKVTGSDWGWHTTLTDNLAKVSQRLPTTGLTSEQSDVVAQRIEEITSALAAAPKSLKWRARAKVGRRVPWYDLPEEAG